MVLSRALTVDERAFMLAALEQLSSVETLTLAPASSTSGAFSPTAS